ncbi:unnamed protein product [Rotaria socialis]|uniref:F-box domain-containing protein n=1 Tax=Rotaria socialis TaxID=392032 RepID=A0A818RPA4_9BILA|nr:unnamed protein product [Rotaria socialis]
MITKIEVLSNEIFLQIFSHLSWLQMLMSLWSLNSRINSLVCSTLSINDYSLNTGLLITLGLSYNKFCSTLFPLILNSSSLSSSIKRIYVDETNSIASDLIYEWLFNDQKILRFPNLKSLILIQCQITEPVVQSLSYLIKHQLNELTFTIDKETTPRFIYGIHSSSMTFHREKQVNLMKQLLRQLFSDECQLTYLRFDFTIYFAKDTIHEWIVSNRTLYSDSIQYRRQSCITLRRLHVRLECTCLLQNLIEHVPNLEQMTVHCRFLLKYDSLCKWKVEVLKQSNENWFKKVPKLRYFSLKTIMYADIGFFYLKWLLNNINYVEKLEIHLMKDKLFKPSCQKMWKSSIDANFVRQYCLPDKITNLIYFNFYISSHCQSSFNDLEKITDSFKTHSFFIDHRWTNVKCLFDPIRSCQHVFSSFTNTFLFSDNRIKYRNIFNWLQINDGLFNLYPSFYLILRQCNELTSTISSIKAYTSKFGFYLDDFLVD